MSITKLNVLMNCHTPLLYPSSWIDPQRPAWGLLKSCVWTAYRLSMPCSVTSTFKPWRGDGWMMSCALHERYTVWIYFKPSQSGGLHCYQICGACDGTIASSTDFSRKATPTWYLSWMNMSWNPRSATPLGTYLSWKCPLPHRSTAPYMGWGPGGGSMAIEPP